MEVSKDNWITNLMLQQNECYGNYYQEAGRFCIKCGMKEKCKEKWNKIYKI